LPAVLTSPSPDARKWAKREAAKDRQLEQRLAEVLESRTQFE